MPRYLDTRGSTSVAIAICSRCSLKFPYSELLPDPNSPGLYVCSDDLDQLDPYRLPARQSEDISLEHPRPDVPLSGQAPTPLYGNRQIDPVIGGAPFLVAPLSLLGTAAPWSALTPYTLGQTITPLNVDNQNVDLPQPWLACIQAGTSGASAPAWPVKTGVTVADGTVIWLAIGERQDSMLTV